MTLTHGNLVAGQAHKVHAGPATRGGEASDQRSPRTAGGDAWSAQAV